MGEMIDPSSEIVGI